MVDLSITQRINDLPGEPNCESWIEVIDLSEQAEKMDFRALVQQRARNNSNFRANRFCSNFIFLNAFPTGRHDNLRCVEGPIICMDLHMPTHGARRLFGANTPSWSAPSSRVFAGQRNGKAGIISVH